MAITKTQIEDICKSIEDPELFIDIWTLGLIYEINIKQEDNQDKLHILMTFTSPMCPYGPQMVEELELKIQQETSINKENLKIEITFEPAWKPSEELREMMGM